MRKHLLGLAMAIPLSAGAAHAATMLTFDPGYYQVEGSPAFSLPFQGTAGTLYVTGTGINTVQRINYYETEVSVEGSGIFAGFDGLATYTGILVAQRPIVTIELDVASLIYKLAISTTSRVDNYVQGDVFTETEVPSPSNLSGDPFPFFEYSVEDSSGNGYDAAADYLCTTSSCPAQYNITSNNTVVAPITVPVTTAVPEPSTWALLVGSLGLAGLFARRRGRLSL